MVKNEKTGLGRSLVKHHNQMINQSKDKGRFYRTQHKVLESVTDVNDIDAVIQQAEDAERFFSDNHPAPNLLINMEEGSSHASMSAEEKRKQQKKEEERHADSLYIPRRPPWTPDMSKDELHENEWKAFLIWRRNLARLEENENLVLTPFEKNLDIWRQLWRVVERSHLIVMVVDARDPLFYRCPDLEAYVKEVDEHKRTLLLVNKADLLPLSIREKWAKYFRAHNILFLFWSAKAAFAAIEEKQQTSVSEEHITSQTIDDVDTKIYGRDELLARLQYEAEEIAKMGGQSYSHTTGSSDVESINGNAPRNFAPKKVMVGFVGYPNVGKSSTINALLCQKRTGVTNTPGKTKHFQTFDIIEDKLTLCDCPGLVFPSFSSSRYDMIASGVLPIDRMTENREAAQIVANRVPRRVIEAVYKISLPKPKPYEPQSRPPLAAELLRSYCASRGFVASSGLPDETKAARKILKDYIDGKLPHYEMPPGMSNTEEDGTEEGVGLQILDSGSLDDIEELNEEDEVESTPVLEEVLDDLNSFDMANGLASAKTTVKKPKAAHKQHKKPQRTKDRTWRVRNDGGDGMPIVRVYQKAVNTGPVRAEGNAGN